MDISFWGVRGTIPAPGPTTVRYGGNTACVSVRLASGELIILDCGTGARNLGNALMSGPFGQGQGRAALMLALAHWDHIQGFPFFVPLYVPGNAFTVFGPDFDPQASEALLEGQMAAQFFPVQTIHNMAASLKVARITDGEPFFVGGARVIALRSRPGPMGALAFRIEDNGKVLVYAGHAGYGLAGPSPDTLALYQSADILIHDATFTPEDKARYPDRGLSSLDEAVAAALAARVRHLVLIHYDQDYADPDVDDLVERGQRALAGHPLTVQAAAEGLTLSL